MDRDAFRGVKLIDVETAALPGGVPRRLGGGRDIGPGHLSRHPVDLQDQHDLRPERLQHPRPLRAVPGRQGDDQRMPQRRAGHGQAGPHIAARHLHDRGGRGEPPIRQGGAQDRAGRPVLDASAGLHEFGFRQDAARSGMDPVEGDQGRAADEIEGGRGDGRWHGRGLGAGDHAAQA